MRYKTLFRVMLKLLGVWLTANGLVSLVSTISNWAAMSLVRMGAGSVSYTYPYWTGLLGSAVSTSIGLYLFFGGKRIVDLAIPGNRPYCHECGYDLTGAAGNICNECWTPFRAPEVTAKHE